MPRPGHVVVAAASALALFVPTTPAQAARGDGSGQHSLRKDLTSENFYFVMGDRFENGDPGNDTGGLGDDPLVSGFDPTGKGFFNGGDLDGLRSQLDYIEGLGTSAIWLTPIFKNKAVQLEDGPSAGYHGYWITDFTRVDPHLGTNADLKDLVEAAHARGMKVFFDIITNHTADVIGYEEGARTAYVPKDVEPYRTASGRPFDDRDYAGTDRFPRLDPRVSFPYVPVLDDAETDLKKPSWLNNPRYYHNRGDTTFVGEDALYGDFFGLDDLFTEHPRVQRGMEEIYESWVGEFGIDGFRIDTMKHVNDEFWQAFGPGIVRYAHEHGKRDFFMFGEVFDDRTRSDGAAFRSHFTTHDKMQSVLDFGFQMATRNYVSQSTSARDLKRFFRTDDWYTDRDSNAYQLPTFLGNHDMGRFGYFLATDNPTADEAELLARDRLAHELMYFARGNPVVYYGDEQGFTGTGGDQLARQTLFASQVPEYQDDDLIGTTSTPAVDNFDTGHPLYRTIARLARITERHPALRNGAQQLRSASDGPGVFAFSRIDRRTQREYVVAVNNSTAPASASVRTFVPDSSFSRLFGDAADSVTTDAHGTAEVTVPGLSAVVYRAQARIPASAAAPRVRLAKPRPTAVAHSRMKVRARVAGSSFAEVTFQARVDDGRWRSIGTDDNAPYRVFHDTSPLSTGQALAYRAVVLDNAGHTRTSAARGTRVPAPRLTITAPADGSVPSVVPVTVTADVQPERATMRVRFEHSVDGGPWTVLGTDSSSPVYTVSDDVTALPVGTHVRYRAVLLEQGTPRVTSDPVRVTLAAPEPERDAVTLVGSLQSELGCAADWDPACADTNLTFDPVDGVWKETFTVPEGSYEWKIAIDGSFDENYGDGGAAGGSNLVLTVPAGGGTYQFTWNQYTHVPDIAEVTP